MSFLEFIASQKPAIDEALGVANAMAATSLPYMISFVIRRTGVVLHGTPLVEAVERIDSLAARPPVGFSINCVRAHVLEAVVEGIVVTRPEVRRRILPFQANRADTEVEELDNSAVLVSEPAEEFADRVARLGHQFGPRVLRICCDTDCAHMTALATKLLHADCQFSATGVRT